MTPAETVDTRGRRALLALARALPASLLGPQAQSPAGAAPAEPERERGRQQPRRESPDGASSEAALAPLGAELERELRIGVLRVAAASLAAARGLAAAREVMVALELGAGTLGDCFAALGAAGGLFASPCPDLDAVAAARTAPALLEARLDMRGDGAGDDEERLGAVHEGMLGVALSRTLGPALQGDPSRAPLDVAAVLALPAEARSQALARAGWRRSGARKQRAVAEAGSPEALLEALGAAPEALLGSGAVVLCATRARRRDGAHYTPVAVARQVVEAALAPLVAGACRVLELRVCDPAVGSGAFLLAASRYLAAAVAARGEADAASARQRVVASCLRGVDVDPLAVMVARTSLWLHAGTPLPAPAALETSLRVGDALVGEAPGDAVQDAELLALAPAHAAPPLHWPRAFGDVVDGQRGGFDACVGNPPWVAYAGRAAEPLEPSLFAYYLRHNAAFHGYRTLHGLFVQRAASLLRPGGRLGLVVPTSVCDLAGYAPVRRAHDALCRADAPLVDLGADAFAGVFQPAMALVSTRLEVDASCGAPHVVAQGRAEAAAWSLARSDLDEVSERLLERLAALRTLPRDAFGERGFQSTGSDAARLRRLPAAEPPFVLPIREGADIAAFVARPPRAFLDPRGTIGRLRGAEAWREVQLLIRQTARFPIAALADGVAFRNSILAGFAREGCGAGLLLAWLNSSPVRWYHYMKNRDARQGMPQVKVAHLRALPAPPPSVAAELEALGARLGARNRGADAEAQRDLDTLAAGALGLDAAERATVARWAASMPLP
ncbi:MAG: N-6 DNA methylase [Polyangiaceae bacterium]